MFPRVCLNSARWLKNLCTH